jgi:16S rRNA (cytosine967-C5)-methyltransferase
MLGLCLRRWGRLNAWYLSKLKEPSRGVPLQTQIALNIALAQLAWLPGVAAHAAVDESVKMVSDPNKGFPQHKGMVNAILRVASKDRELLGAELGALPIELDQSEFAGQLLRSALQGQCTIENINCLWSKLQKPPSPAFTVLRGDPPVGLVPDAQYPKAWRLGPKMGFPAEWLRSGAGMVQDVSSQALLDFEWGIEDKDSSRILDACAAPGGKTTVLASRWPNVQTFALDQHPERLDVLKKNLAARNIKAQVLLAEASKWMRSGGKPFDLILVDAPCSASGTIRKHPELNWIFNISEVARLAGVQENLLEAAISRLRLGGLLIYSVCSWFPEEGLDHLQRILSRHPNLAPAPIWRTQNFFGGEAKHIFRPDPLAWDGEGFQGFALQRVRE